MKRLIVGLLLLVPGAMLAQQTMRWYRIPEVTIYGKRTMKEIGVQKTQMDSVVLKENIALCEELWTCHTFYGSIPWYIAFSHTSYMERYAYQ